MDGPSRFLIPVGTRNIFVLQNAQDTCVQHSLLEEGQVPASDRFENFTAFLYFTI